MPEVIRNAFMSHRHEDDEGLARVKDLVNRHGITLRDYSITSEKPNAAQNPDYIKYKILAPQIRSAGVFLTYITPGTKNSEWVNWEIEYAHKQGKRIVGIWAYGAKDCELPEALDRYGHAVVGWNGESIVDAINGKSDQWYNQDGSKRGYRATKRFSC